MCLDRLARVADTMSWSKLPDVDESGSQDGLAIEKHRKRNQDLGT